MPNIIDLESARIRRSSRLANNPPKNGLFEKLSFDVIGKFEVDNNSNIFPTRANQHNQEINKQFDETLNHFDSLIFTEY